MPTSPNEAAAKLEDITVVSKQMVVDIREEVVDPYAALYWLRREIGRIVSTMGVGLPASDMLRQVQDRYRILHDEE